MAVGDVYVFPGFLTPVLTQLFFPKPPTTFLTEVRGENTPERKFSSTGDRTHYHQVTLTTEPPGLGPQFGDLLIGVGDALALSQTRNF